MLGERIVVSSGFQVGVVGVANRGTYVRVAVDLLLWTCCCGPAAASSVTITRMSSSVGSIAVVWLQVNTTFHLPPGDLAWSAGPTFPDLYAYQSPEGSKGLLAGQVVVSVGNMVLAVKAIDLPAPEVGPVRSRVGCC